MRILSLTVQNFRNIEAASLEFPPGPQLFVGKNAQGKTSLLEAVYFLATATSHRTHRNNELIRKEAPAAFVSAVFESAGSQVTLSGGIDDKVRQFRLDGRQLPRSSDLYGHLRAVFFSPEDLEIVSGPPAHRRRFLDLGMCQIQPGMVRVLLDYRRVLRQRNALLKTRTSPEEARKHTLATWDPQLAKLGAQVVHHRAVYVLHLLESARQHYSWITDAMEDLSGEYQSSGTKNGWSEISQVPSLADLEEALASALRKSLDHDLAMKSTTTGPHRDDINLQIGGRSAFRYASQGQRRSLALSIKLAEGDLLTEDHDPPVLLVDDVTHEMDAGRCRKFLEKIAERGQAFLTFTEVPRERAMLQGETLWCVESGAFRPGSASDPIPLA